MGKDRITVSQLIAWLSRYSADAKICFVTGNMIEGQAMMELYEISERPIEGPAPVDGKETLVLIRVQ